MNVLITGGAGFIGSHLAAHHLELNDSVYVVDDFSAGRMENINPFLSNPNFKFEKADLCHWQNINNAVAWADRIYHMAAIVGVKKVLLDPKAVISSNLGATEKLFNAISEVKPTVRTLLASTSEVYGFNSKECFSEDDDLVFRSTNPVRWCYAVTKLADEHIALAYHHQSSMNVVVSRIFNSIGPNQTNRYGWVVPTFIKQSLANQPLTVYGDGTQTRSFCDVRDTALALEQITSSDIESGEIVNIGRDEEISILDLAKLIISRTNSKSPIKFVPYLEAYGIEFEDIAHRRPVLDKLYKYTGFEFKWNLINTIDNLIKLELDATNNPTR